MHHFHYQDGELHCESVPLSRIAEKTGTPVYVYSYATLERHFKVFDLAFAGLPHLLCFSMKANSNLAILRAIRRFGGGVDIVSGGELFRATTAGVPASRIVYSGVGKTEEEMASALRAGIFLFNVESEEELAALDRVALSLGCRAPVAIRINPDINPRTHPSISTGLKKSKFGIQVRDSLELYRRSKKMSGISIRGISCHIGSQIVRIGPFIEAVKRLRELVEKLRADGHTIRYLDFGGGLGIPYKDEVPPSPAQYGKALSKWLSGLDVIVLFEPGRVIAGNAGILLTKVLYRKRQGTRRFVVVDGAMNDLIRPALYGSYHEILPVRRTGGKKERVDVVGPVCESGDFFALGRPFPPVKSKDLLAIMSAGAYGFVMASRYNSRLLVPEVLVKEKEFFIVRRREEYKDLLKGEHVPKFLI